MRRDELQAGTDYAYRQHRYGETIRVTVLSTEPRPQLSSGYSRRPLNGVLVMHHGRDMQVVLLPRDITHTWEEELQVRSEREARQAERDAERSRNYAVVNALRGLGIETEVNPRDRYGYVTVKVEVAEELAHKLKRDASLLAHLGVQR